jgi:hypothetical protein
VKILRWIRSFFQAYWKGIKESGGSLNTTRRTEQMLREYKKTPQEDEPTDNGL